MDCFYEKTDDVSKLPRHHHRCRFCGRSKFSRRTNPFELHTQNCPQQPGYIPPQGPGTELNRLFSELGIGYSKSCACDEIARKMDAAGADGCEDNKAAIIEAIWSNFGKMTIKEKLGAMRGGVNAVVLFKSSPKQLLATLIDEAIKRARECKTTPS